MEYSEVVTGRDSAEERAVQAEDLLSVHCGHSTNVECLGRGYRRQVE